MMNQHSLKVFEYQSIIEKIKNFSLSEDGKENIQKLTPVLKYDEASELIKETIDAVTYLNSKPHPLIGIKNIASSLKRLSLETDLSPKEIWNIANNIQIISNLKQTLKKNNKYFSLQMILQDIDGLPELIKEIFKSISEEGEVLDEASVELRSIRKKISILKSRLKKHLEEFISNPTNKTFLQENYVTERNGRWVVPVKNDYKNSFPGIVHDISASGLTVFMEPLSIIAQTNEVIIQGKKESEEVHRILKQFSEKLLSRFIDLDNLFKASTRIETIFAKALYGITLNCVIPEIVVDNKIEIIGGIHPLLNVKAVPVNIEIGSSYRTLIITGPNTGGKTVTLKMVGLFALLAQSGIPVPARKAVFGVFSNIFADIGDEQSITQNMSTFSSHITNIASFINAINENTLVILDELGAGTDPQEGASLAYAISTYLHSKNPLMIISTHHSNLKTFAYSFPNSANGSMEFDLQSLKPTYKLIIGVPGRSFALYVASNLGIPEEIIELANSYLPETQKEYSELVNSLDKARVSYEKKILELETITIESQETIHKYLKLNEDLNIKKHLILSDIRSEGKKQIEEIIISLKNALKKIAENEISVKEAQKIYQNQKEKVATFVTEQTQKQQNLVDKSDFIYPDKYSVNDKVYLESLNQFGKIVKLYTSRNSALIEIGLLKTEMPLDMLKIKKSSIQQNHKTDAISTINLLPQSATSPVLDLHGMRAGEAIDSLEQYFEQTYLSNLKYVRIIHGIGKGILKKIIRDYLKKHPYVASFTPDPEEGEGVTLVYFK